MLHGIATTGTLRGAAKAACIKQSAVSRHLERLERRIGATLTIGGPDNIRLSETGAAMLTSGHRLLSRLAEAVARITDDTGTAGSSLPRTLRLAAVGAEWDEFVDDVARNLPSLVPAVVSAGPEECRELFDRYHVDTVYTWQPFAEGSRLSRPAETYRVVDEPMWIGLPATHPCARNTTVSLKDLRTDEWIVGPDAAVRQALVAACNRAGFEPRIRQVAESTSVARSLLWQGGGVALLSPVSVPPGDDAAFVIRPLADGPHRAYVLATDPAIVPDLLARALCVRLRASYRKRALRLNPAYAASLGSHPASAATPADVEDLGSTLAAPSQPSRLEDSQIEPEDVIMLRVIAESGSLNRAAPTLLISQPALTRRLKLIERRLGVKLLVRGYSGTVLTAKAQELVDAVAAAEQDFHTTMQPLLNRVSRSAAADGRPTTLSLASNRRSARYLRSPHLRGGRAHKAAPGERPLAAVDGRLK